MEIFIIMALILELPEHSPHEGEKLSWRGFDFEVMDRYGARIDKVLVTRPELPSDL